jgi:1-acyl-sn-glycerol-3-phosphate acyltransferase
LYPVARRVIVPVFNRAWRLTVEGLDNVPATGPAIFCPNHVSVLDSFFLPAVLPRRITYVGKAEYMDDWKTRHLFPALGMIPIDRSGGSAADAALDAAAGVLERGEFFGIYPEGTRSRDGRLHRGHTGPARLALRTGAPLIPVGLVGTLDVMPADAKFPKLRRSVTVRIGRPITVDKYVGVEHDRLLLRQLIDEVMFEVRELSGQEYVDEYASKPRAAQPAVVATSAISPAPTSTAMPDGIEPEPLPEPLPEGDPARAAASAGAGDCDPSTEPDLAPATAGGRLSGAEPVPVGAVANSAERHDHDLDLVAAGRTDVVDATVGAAGRSSADVLRPREFAPPA